MVNPFFIAAHDKISGFAKTQPDAIAVICGEQEYTYKELDEQSDLFAAALAKLVPETGRGKFVSLLLNRSFFVHVAIIGVLKTGAAFIPFTPDIPIERIKFSVKNAESKVLITTEKIKESLPDLEDSSYKVLTVEELLLKAENEHLEKPEVCVLPSDMAMCIYTSGSTGNPKGVLLDHRSVFEEYRSEHLNKVFPCVPHRIGDICPFTYILFYSTFFYHLYAGVAMYVNAEVELKDLNRFADQIFKHRIDVIMGIPSFFDMFTSLVDKRKLESLNGLIMGGEALSAEVCKRLFVALPSIRITYGYGCTESNSAALYKIIRNAEEPFTNGIPHDKIHAIIVDENGIEVPIHEKGELLLQGETISQGYLNDPKETAKCFVDYNGKKAYKTGDRAYKNENGEFVICGRTDDMVKFHGQRVELPEIEKNLLKIPSIRQACVLLRAAEDFIAAFIVSDQKIHSKEIKEILSKSLPPYMIPSVFVQLEKMPVNAHGKVDKKSLKTMKIEFEESECLSSKSVETILCDAIKNVLGLEKDISLKDDFFELGGSSISAVELVL
ncbi:MAG: AMP-binding protein, partial [Fibrobacter sp.]|nr:AMP-binding protein [Fibrobacter sp.]